MICEFCGTDGPDVMVRPDPFAWDVNDEDWQIPMCGSCEQNRADET